MSNELLVTAHAFEVKNVSAAVVLSQQAPLEARPLTGQAKNLIDFEILASPKQDNITPCYSKV